MRPNDNEKKLHRHNLLFKQWITNYQQGKSIGGYLLSRNITRVGIYGYTDIGDLLVNDLHKAGVQVVYYTDKRADELRKFDTKLIDTSKIKDYSVDAVIVAAIIGFYEIRDSIPNSNVISLEDVIYELGGDFE